MFSQGGRDRGRDNFIFFQVGKGRGLIPPRPDVLLLVLRKYKAPGPRRLPPGRCGHATSSLRHAARHRTHYLIGHTVAHYLLCATSASHA